MRQYMDVQKLTETAVGYALSFEKSFTFIPEDIRELDDILQYYYEESGKSKPTQDQIWSMSLIWGAYLGETMLRNFGRQLGFEWVMEEDQPVITKTGGGTVAPVSKVFKRLQNGPEDSVLSFYEVMKDILSRE